MVHSSPNTIRTVICASESQIKFEAVQQALGFWYNLDCIDLRPVPTNLEHQPDWRVNAQPYGILTTELYARMRADHATSMVSFPWNLVIAIENGVYARIDHPDSHYDLAVVYLKTWNHYSVLKYSPPVMVPDWAYLEAKERGLRRTTCGEIINEHYPHIPANDWHPFSQSLCRQDETPMRDGIGRKEQLLHALHDALYTLLAYSPL